MSHNRCFMVIGSKLRMAVNEGCRAFCGSLPAKLPFDTQRGPGSEKCVAWARFAVAPPPDGWLSSVTWDIPRWPLATCCHLDTQPQFDTRRCSPCPRANSNCIGTKVNPFPPSHGPDSHGGTQCNPKQCWNGGGAAGAIPSTA